MDLVRLHNTGPKPIEFNGNDRVVIAPGGSRIVTWDFACAWLGTPTIRDVQERAAAYKLTCLQWGYADGMDTPADWEMKKPTIRTETIDGELVAMLIDDPDGTAILPGEEGDLTQIESADAVVLKAQLAQMEAKMERLMQLVAASTADPVASLDPATETALSTTTEDAPVGTELPKPVATPADAKDTPRAAKIR